MALEFGGGSTIVLSVTGTVMHAAVKEIQMGEHSLGKEESLALSITGFKQYDFHDTVDPGMVTADYEIDSTEAMPALGAAETCTVTLGSTSATYAGSGALTKATLPTLAQNVPLTGSLEFSFDGVTGPTFTPGA